MSGRRTLPAEFDLGEQVEGSPEPGVCRILAGVNHADAVGKFTGEGLHLQVERDGTQTVQFDGSKGVEVALP